MDHMFLKGRSSWCEFLNSEFYFALILDFRVAESIGIGKNIPIFHI